MGQRVLVAVVAVCVVAAAVVVGTYRRADSVCAADPPGSSLTAFERRELDLWVNGWHCRLSGVGDTTVGVPLGWWPTTDKMR